MKPNAIKIPCIYVAIPGHAQRLLVSMQLSTPRLLARLLQTYADTAAKNFPTLRIGRHEQNI